jgi:hypothetical protein
MVRYWIMLATVTHVLRDRGFQAKVITGALGAVALAQLGRDNQARPVRRAADWYSKLGVKGEVARVREALEPEVARVRGALEPGATPPDASGPAAERVISAGRQGR